MRKTNLKYMFILLVFVWGHLFAQLDGFNHCRHSEQKNNQVQTEHSCCSTKTNQASDSQKDSDKDSKARTCVNFASIAPPQNLFFDHEVDVTYPINHTNSSSLLLSDPDGLFHPPRA